MILVAIELYDKALAIRKRKMKPQPNFHSAVISAELHGLCGKSAIVIANHHNLRRAEPARSPLGLL